MNVPFLQDSTFTGLISTRDYKTSREWSQAFTTVQTNSGTWSSGGPGTSGLDIATLNTYLSTNSVLLCSLNVNGTILSADVPLDDVLLQTVSYNEPNEQLSISQRNTISLSALSYRNLSIPLSTVATIEQFATSYTGSIHPGYNVTLYNGRVYTFAGTDKNNPNHYLEVNANPYKPIYREVPLSTNQAVIDSFYLGDFKTAKYNLQIETNFNNDIYYSEINVVGSVQTSVGVACEYGQIYTDQLILGYDVTVDLNTIDLIMLYSADLTPGRKLFVKGHRTNFYKI